MYSRYFVAEFTFQAVLFDDPPGWVSVCADYQLQLTFVYEADRDKWRMPTELHVSIKWQNVIILVGITTSCAKNQGGSSDVVVVPCVIKLESVCMFESDVAEEQVL